MRSRLSAFAAVSVICVVLAALPAAQAANPRLGKWRLKPTDPAQTSNNVMTYEAFNGTGMKVTINTLQPDGTLTPQWGYTTMFDNKETPMTGSRSADTAAVSRRKGKAADDKLLAAQALHFDPIATSSGRVWPVAALGNDAL